MLKNAAHSSRDMESCQEAQPLLDGKVPGISYTAQDSQKILAQDSASPSVTSSGPYLHADHNGHYPCLDVVRILCVFLCVVDHGGTKFGVWNTMYVQSWVLQYLYYVCGFVFGVSSRPLLSYCSRLGLYFVIGVGVNLCAWSIAGMTVRTNIFGMVFQFWFVFGLIIFLCALAPMKRCLANARDAARSMPWPSVSNVAGVSASFPEKEGGWEVARELSKGILVMTVSSGIIHVLNKLVAMPVLVTLFTGPLRPAMESIGESSKFWGLPAGDNRGDWEVFCSNWLRDTEVSVTNVFIVLIFIRITSKLPLTMWVLFLNTYIHKCTLYRSQTCRMLNAFDYTLTGLAFHYLGISGRRVIGEYLTRYWFLFLFTCSLLWQPGMSGRFDESPPTDLNVRMRYYLLEFWFALFFFTAVERFVDERIFSKDRLHYLGHWALLIFLIHGFFRVLATPLEYWCMLLGTIPLCKLMFGGGQPKARRDAASSNDGGNDSL
mmetsp:Transcript_57874/g.111617  ORF Transcript_57874/g.111617 Transcript_57874/m.111617 type:complete len:490 (-) Transcript_57874:2-1471(-)|eukprot:CAMPEP_0172661954 /NCGR_PEP_ID=MMETSP1074-20121228/5049_1 /TAXON_ID=2916 /ORGANISM="Ceratium fusus, Strain PA161109" /LENGTH=489 /DNA_ID=CAMNT_0013477801 /DNA_START=52 /DNA_END=1521 /DNA_ORIENTATION=+